MTGWSVSSADRIVYPEAGITKGEVVDYYDAVSRQMIGHLAARPLTLQRFPKGLSGDGFMQKNTPAHYPESIERFVVDKREGGTTTYPVVHDAADIPYLANQGTITFHVWPSRLPEVWTPDRLIIDLDPTEGAVADVRRAGRIVEELLTEIGLPSVPVATGSKGFHIVSPIRPTEPADRLSAVMYRTAHLLAQRHSELLTIEFRKERRGARVFVDWMRNHPGATSVCPWSLRARPSAPVAVPLAWDEFDDTAPDQWTLRTATARLDSVDPLATLTAQAPDPSSAITTLDEMLDEAGIDPEPFDRFRS